MKYIVFLLAILMVGCVSVPPHLTSIHRQAPINIPFPSSGNSMVLFQPGYPKTLGLVKFDDEKSSSGLRNFVNAIEFQPGVHTIATGMLHRYGELNVQLEWSSSVTHNFEAGKKYRIFSKDNGSKELILEEIKPNGTSVEVTKF